MADAPLANARFGILFVEVNDLERSAGFYRDTLGLPVYFELEGVCTFLNTDADGTGPALAL